MTKTLLNTIIPKHHDLYVSPRSIMFLGFRRRQMIDSLSADNSRYFAQLRPIFVKSFILTETLNVLKSSFVIYLTNFIFNQHGTFSTN